MSLTSDEWNRNGEAYPEQLQRVRLSIARIRCSLLSPALKKTLLVGNPQKSRVFEALCKWNGTYQCNFLTLSARLLEHLAPFCHFGVWQSGTTRKPWLQRPKATRTFYPKTQDLETRWTATLPDSRNGLVSSTADCSSSAQLKASKLLFHPSQYIAWATQQFYHVRVHFSETKSLEANFVKSTEASAENGHISQRVL